MLLAALGFSIMGGAAKSLKEVSLPVNWYFTGMLIGLLVLIPGLLIKPPSTRVENSCGLHLPGIMGTIALIHFVILYSAYSPRNSDEL